VSLILEALRKLERDRKSPDPGVVVVGVQAWPARSTTARNIGIAFCAVALVAFGFWLGTAPHLPSGAAPAVPSVSPEAPQGLRSPASSGEISARERWVAAPSSTPSPTGRRSLEASSTLEPRAAVSPADEGPRPLPTEESRSDEPTGGIREETVVVIEPTGGALPRLHAITRQGDRNVALLDDHVVSEGDAYNGWKVMRIGDSEVEIDVAGRRHILRF
jgi:hypothetical protein